MSQSDDYEAAFEAALTTLRRTPLAIRESRRRKIAEQIAELERELQLLDSLPESENGVPHPNQLAIRDGDPEPETEANAVPATVPNKPQGLLMVIAEHPNRTWKLSDARDVMVERGWLQPGEKGTHQIQNTAWKLKNRGHLKSRRTGHYRITPQGMEAIGR